MHNKELFDYTNGLHFLVIISEVWPLLTMTSQKSLDIFASVCFGEASLIHFAPRSDIILLSPTLYWKL